MKLQVLGCAGGIGGREQLTTCLWLDHDVLLDAGTGLSTLSLHQLCTIDHVFLTHSHLDHVAGLAFLLDSVLGKRHTPITVHASATVIHTLKTHLFNWQLWPDFTVIPSPTNGILRWEVMEPGSTLQINDKHIQSKPVNHTVDAVAYWVHNRMNGFLFTGDLSHSPDLWACFANEEKLRHVIVDCSFPNSAAELAHESKHYCPKSLQSDIRAMPKSIEFSVTHLKPGQENLILSELRSNSERQFNALYSGAQFTY
ncbi:3',5'-cyclic-nucleotide phosphodiesterase [Solimicrobium silvestre]|uniref:Beta-lactamase superfamily domain n=1 Tax=Solimicrobium silvestre TaxID=2099400 RepID=A0A2S9GYD5_9BURK|nr:3',5'-cyclic-nucleotide phosphodiesterase [Solimicrobium silvestre]PRC92721.1 Beta-lactamase superfamily domain [Solimicrobium silvestre]